MTLGGLTTVLNDVILEWCLTMLGDLSYVAWFHEMMNIQWLKL